MLMRLAKVLNAEQLAGINAALSRDDAPWVDGRATAGHQGAAVKRNEQIDEGSAAARALGDTVLGALERNAPFISAALPNRVYPPLFNRYTDGMQFGSHVDGAVRIIAATGQKLRTDLSATIFLVSPESYDGGELIIEGSSGTQAVKLAAGDMVLYPASTRHRVTAVTRGARLASFFWIQSLVRDHFQRAQLFELDGAIQRLTASGADADALVTLAGHYHNLLRLWSEP